MILICSRFFEARDGIIQADEILTGGENLCEIWEGFSERGLVRCFVRYSLGIELTGTLGT